MNIILDRNNYAYLHDAVFDIFGESLNKSQLDKLIKLHPDFDGVMDTLGRGEIMDRICIYFIQMAVPTYGSSAGYEAEFEQKIAGSKAAFNEYVKVYPFENN
ncbi:hypothetical protein EON73_02530 [bacterium]|nr:MAG: hypothetical protein EON73_02530 [bacterium]